MFTLIAYDVESDKLRARIAKYLEGHGTRVQYSVFELHHAPAEYREVKKQLEAFIKRYRQRIEKQGKVPGTASIRLYRLCAPCEDRVEIIGDGDFTEDYAYYMA